MKIMMIAAADLPIPAIKGGATETLMTELLAQRFIKDNKEIQIDVFCHCKGSNYVDGNVAYNYIIPKLTDKIYFTFYRIRRLLLLRKVNIPDDFPIVLNKIVDFNQYDLVLLEGNKNQVINLRKYYHGIIALHIHTVITFTKETPDAKKIFDLCDYLIANSKFAQSEMQKINPAAEGKVLLWPNCVNADLFNIKSNSNHSLALRSQFKISSEEFVYLYCGRLEDGKGVLELIKAFKQIGENCRLIIVGASWFSSNKKTPYIQKLEKESEGLNDKIVFTGYVKHENLPDYYKMANVVVMPSKYNEAAGLVAVESQLCGVPAIVSNVGGLPEFVHKKSCLKVNVDKKFVDNLSLKMKEIKNNKDLFNIEKKLAIENANRFTMDQYAKRFAEILEIINDQ